MSRPAPLYSVSLALWYRLLVLGVSAIILAMLIVSLIMAVSGENGPLWGVVIPLLPLVVLLLVLMTRGLTQRFRVDPLGVELRGILRTHRIPWQQVAIVEVDRSFLHRGATVVVTRDGRRRRSELTAARWALRRGERTSDHGSSLTDPARPTRAAIAAHRDYLHRAANARSRPPAV